MMNNGIRIVLAIIAYASVLFAPLWVTLACALVLCARWRAWEVLALGVLVDILFLPGAFAFGIPFPGTLISLLLLWGFEPLRRQLVVSAS